MVTLAGTRFSRPVSTLPLLPVSFRTMVSPLYASVSTIDSALLLHIYFIAWYEWYPNYAYDFTGISIKAGNTIKLTVTATTPFTGSAVIENLSNGETVTKSLISLAALCEENAEWIVEDYEEGSSLVPFANFGTVTFTVSIQFRYSLLRTNFLILYCFRISGCCRHYLHWNRRSFGLYSHRYQIRAWHRPYCSLDWFDHRHRHLHLSRFSQMTDVLGTNGVGQLLGVSMPLDPCRIFNLQNVWEQ